jgi:ATP-dependent helicase HrpA
MEARRAAHAAIVEQRRLTYPGSLPITERHDELLAAIEANQVVIVAGETGSGKSTQLPKMCLELGRGVDGIIGHTQPRRMAARTIAERVAEELGSPLGADVGYTVRFTDRVGGATLVKVMTDGILLAELQRDRSLRRYDTLLIDEAHERSLNIDFILGYLKQLLPRRPDLKVIVTSATIDTERFARHFAVDGRDAPVVEVSGRTYPVEVRYRPVGEDANDDRDQVQAVVDAVEELAREGNGDVLVFLSGEREIHDAADALRRAGLRDTDVLPLYARLSSAEQHRIFQPHPGRRVVLSTNVAETSLTVPGVRYVVDAGTARISRYSRRLKVQRLPIESISQASADQRAGRCGRVAPGVCIRLYSEDDFDGRPAFTEPEILRTNLASVILQMTAIGLGDVAAFPFIEPPDAAAVRDGYLLLEELSAVDDPAGDGAQRRLTPIGRQLARLPIDPRLGRMILAGDRLGCLREVMVIATALSIQDPRERPTEHQQAADELHRRFDVDGSDLLSIVALWDHLRRRQRELSSNQFRKLCRNEYLNYLRVREWQDLFSQVRQVAGELGLRPGTDSGHPDRVHQAVLAGLLSHVGMRDRDERQYRGARGSMFVIARGSVLSRRGTRWVMAAELVETNRLWARRVAAIKPEWIESAGTHLVKRSYGEPRWNADRGRVETSETVTLYGLPIVSNRTVGYDRVDPATARELFVRHALVDGDWHTQHAFAERNVEFVERAATMQARARRVDLLDDEAVFRFYDERVGADVVSARHFDRWWKDASAARPDLLDLTDDVLAGDRHVDRGDFPDVWRHGELALPLTYRFDPGGPLDGVAVHVPLTALNQVTADGFDWQVPGNRGELVAALVRTLPKDIRRRLIPAAETVRAAYERLLPPHGLLVDALASALTEVSGVRVRAADFDTTRVPDHLRMNFVITDADGTVHDADDDLDTIRARLAGSARRAIAAGSPVAERSGIVEWDVGTLPRVVEVADGRHVAKGYPALVDDGDCVSLRVLTDEAEQHRSMHAGVRRLLVLAAGPSARSVRAGLGNAARLVLAGSGITADELVDDCILAAVDRVLSDHGLPWDADAFGVVRRDVRDRAGRVAADALSSAIDTLTDAAHVRATLGSLRAESLRPAVADASAHLARLVRPGFVVDATTRRLPDVNRYVRAIDQRLSNLGGDVARDTRRMAEVVPLEGRYSAHRASLAAGPVGPEMIELGWQLEELRVSVFAQSLGVRGGVSAKKVTRALDALGA